MDGTPKKHTSIIWSSWSMNEERRGVLRKSLESLIETAKDTEIFIVDNGEDLEDSKWFLEKTHNKEIACYIRNRHNLHFGMARNQGLKMATGEYIVISDNDIIFEDGWLEECIEFLEKHEGKYLATPMNVDRAHTHPKYFQGECDGWKLNMRAGSNIFVMRRSDFEQIGYFRIHRIAGTKFTDTYVKMGYLMACMPEPKCSDMGFTRGYDLGKEIEHLEL